MSQMRDYVKSNLWRQRVQDPTVLILAVLCELRTATRRNHEDMATSTFHVQHLTHLQLVHIGRRQPSTSKGVRRQDRTKRNTGDAWNLREGTWKALMTDPI
jgi:hypothetical protein